MKVLTQKLLQQRQWSYLLLGAAVAANGPQVLEGSPHQDNEETSEEGDHGGGEESPPHPLAVAVAGHVGREGYDEVHLGDVDGRVWIELLPALGHLAELVVVIVVVVGHLTASSQPASQRSAAERLVSSGASGSSGQRSLMPPRLCHVELDHHHRQQQQQQ